MISDETKKKIMALCNKPVALGGWLGMREENCMQFCLRVYREMGIETDENAIKAARDFIKVDKPQFGDIAVFQGMMLDPFHLGIMLDYRRCIQSVENTNGVGKVDISRYPWDVSLRGFYRYKDL